MEMPYMKQNKKLKQTFKSAQNGLEIIFTHNKVSWRLDDYQGIIILL